MRVDIDPFTGRPYRVNEETKVIERHFGGAAEVDLSNYYTKAQVDALAYSDEKVDDRVSSLIQDGTGITWVYNDAAGTLTPTVAPTAASINSALDTAWTDDTSVTVTDLFGGTVNLGTGGEFRLRYKRVGRTITMQIYFEVGASPTFGNGGPWKLNPAELPAAAKQVAAPSGYNYTIASGFGFYSSGTNGMMEGIKPAIANTGSGGTLIFVVDPGDGSLGNLFYPGNPIPVLEGDNYQGQITYEANAVA